MNQDEIDTKAAAGAAASAAATVVTTTKVVVQRRAAAEAAAPAAGFVFVSSWLMMFSDWFLTDLSQFLTAYVGYYVDRL